MLVSSLVLPRIGLGMAALGRPGYINLGRGSIKFGGGNNNGTGSEDDNNDSASPSSSSSLSRSIEDMQTQANLVLDSLFEETNSSSSSSKPWIDCARSYGLSEKFVSEYLRTNNIHPNDVYISSKWGYTYVADWKVQLESGKPHEVKDHSVENFLKQIEETMNYLGEYLDLYQIHSATFESGVLDNSDVHKALYKCKTDHGIAIGLSVSSPQQNEIIQKALSVEVDGTKLFDSVQCTYNIFEQKPGPMLEQAYTEYGIDIIVKEGMANGRILQNPIIKQYAQQLQCTPDALALACVLAQKFHPSVLSGAVTPEQLQSNSEALSVMEHYFQQRNEDGSSDLLSEIMDQTRMDSNTYWTDRSQLTWN